MEIVKIFQDKKVRTYLDAENEDRFFSEVDEVALLTYSINLISYMETNSRCYLLQQTLLPSNVSLRKMVQINILLHHLMLLLRITGNTDGLIFTSVVLPSIPLSH